MGKLNFLDRCLCFKVSIDYVNTLCKLTYDAVPISSFENKTIDLAQPIRSCKNVYLKIPTFIESMEKTLNSSTYEQSWQLFPH